jgi:hypothetical protein
MSLIGNKTTNSKTLRANAFVYAAQSKKGYKMADLPNF